MLYKKYKIAKAEVYNYFSLIEFDSGNLIIKELPKLKYRRCKYEDTMRLVEEQLRSEEKYCVHGFGNGESLLWMNKLSEVVHYLYITEKPANFYKHLHKEEKSSKKPESSLKKTLRRLLNIIMWN